MIWPDLEGEIRQIWFVLMFSAMLVTEKSSSSVEATKSNGGKGGSGSFRRLVADFIGFPSGKGGVMGKERGEQHMGVVFIDRFFTIFPAMKVAGIAMGRWIFWSLWCFWSNLRERVVADSLGVEAWLLCVRKGLAGGVG